MKETEGEGMQRPTKPKLDRPIPTLHLHITVEVVNGSAQIRKPKSNTTGTHTRNVERVLSAAKAVSDGEGFIASYALRSRLRADMDNAPGWRKAYERGVAAAIDQDLLEPALNKDGTNGFIRLHDPNSATLLSPLRS